MMLHQCHLSDEIGGGDQFWLCIAPRHHDMQTGPPRSQRGDDGGKIEIVVAQCDIELIEDDHRQARIGDEFARFAPGASAAATSRARSWVSQVNPRPWCARRVARRTFAARLAPPMPGALDELHHADAMTAPEHAQGKPEGADVFPLPVPVWTMSRPSRSSSRATSASCTALRLAILARCCSASASSSDCVMTSLYNFPFMASGNPATTRTTRSARAAMRLVENAL